MSEKRASNFFFPHSLALIFYCQGTQCHLAILQTRCSTDLLGFRHHPRYTAGQQTRTGLSSTARLAAETKAHWDKTLEAREWPATTDGSLGLRGASLAQSAPWPTTSSYRGCLASPHPPTQAILPKTRPCRSTPPSVAWMRTAMRAHRSDLCPSSGAT